MLQKHHKENYLFVVSDVNKDNLAGLEKSKLRYTRAVMYFPLRAKSASIAVDEQSFSLLCSFRFDGIMFLQ